MRALVSLLVLLAACKQPVTQTRPNAPAVDAANAAAPVASASASASVPAAPRTCAIVPERGVVLGAAARATDIKIASTAAKALVTWFEHTPANDGGRPGPPVDVTYAQTFDGALGPRTEIVKMDVGDEPISAPAPVALGEDLFTFECQWFAPSGRYTCEKRPFGASPTPLFLFEHMNGGGPEQPAIAVVARKDDAAIFVPDGWGPEPRVLTASASKSRRSAPFATGFRETDPHADALVAVPLGADALLAYRTKGELFARRAGFDEAWREKPRKLSAAKKGEVGAPALATNGTDAVALFAERASAKDPWQITRATIGADVTRTPLELGVGQAQAPGIASSGACWVVSWVEGTGKATTTRLGRDCPGKPIDAVTTLSAPGNEGGRAYPTKDFVVWQELPAGKPAELRIAKLACP